MALKFNSLGYVFEPFDSKPDEVAIVEVSKSAQGKIIFPKMVEDSGKTYKVTNIGTRLYTVTGLLESIPVTELIIPSSVKKINARAFSKSKFLKSVKIAEGLEEINSNAFYECTQLESIEIPSTVLKIYSSAFYGCSKLAEVKLDTSMDYISDWAFGSCTSLRSIVIPDTVKKINESAFNGCTSLKRIAIPASVEIIGSKAFQGCENIQVDIYNDEGEVTIASDAFPASAKINYLGKKKAPKAAETPKPQPEKVEKAAPTVKEAPKKEEKTTAEKTEKVADGDLRLMWVLRSTEELVALGEKIVSLVNPVATTKYELRYTNSYIGLGNNGKPSNFAWFIPRKKDIQLSIKVKQNAEFDKLMDGKFAGNWAYKNDLYCINMTSGIEDLAPVLQAAEHQFKK